MAKRSAIKKTAICWWEAEDEVYLVRSALFPIAIAQGETEADAWSAYEDVLDDALENLSKGKLGGYAANGRPAKGGVNIHCQVQPFSKETLNHFAEEFGISQGEVIDWALFMVQHKFYEVQPPAQAAAAANALDLFSTVAEASNYPSNVEQPQRLNYNDPSGGRAFSMSTECFRSAFIRQIFSMKDEEINEMASAIRNQCAHEFDHSQASPKKGASME